MSDDTPKLPAISITWIAATSATTDEAMVASWLAGLRSAHTRRNFEISAQRFLAALRKPLRQATVEDVRTALEALTAGLAPSSARQVVLRVKSLLSYGHRLGYLQFNAGVVIKVGTAAQSVAKQIISEVEIGLLVRAADTKRDRLLIKVGYAGGLRVSELVRLTWGDVIAREKGVQLNVLGKGGKVRQVLLPEVVSRSLLSLRGDAGAIDPVFVSQKTGGHLTERAVNFVLTATAERAGVNPDLSAHWLRHAHASHALDHGATLAEVQTTLGHGSVAVTSAYLHARPDTSSGLRLDPGIIASMTRKSHGKSLGVDIGKRIKGARTDAELSQKHLAEACGVSVPAVHGWETGKSSAPAHALVKISELANVGLTWLMTGKRTPSHSAAGGLGGRWKCRAAPVPEHGMTLGPDQAVFALDPSSRSLRTGDRGVRRRLNEDGRKLFAGGIGPPDPQLVLVGAGPLSDLSSSSAMSSGSADRRGGFPMVRTIAASVLCPAVIGCKR